MGRVRIVVIAVEKMEVKVLCTLMDIGFSYLGKDLFQTEFAWTAEKIEGRQSALLQLAQDIFRLQITWH